MKAIHILIRNVPDDVEADWLLEEISDGYDLLSQKEVDYLELEFLEERSE